MPYYWNCGAGFGFWWIFPLLFGTLWIVLLVGLIWRRRHWHGHGWHGPGGSATEVLRERFARGEIDEKEYESRRRILDTRS